MKGGRILSDPQIDEMAELRERGWSLPRIARHFTANGTPISPAAIGWQCLRVGADLPVAMRRPTGTRTWGRGRAFTPDEDRRLLELEGRSLPVKSIATALGRKHNSIIGRMRILARQDARREDLAA